MSKKCAFLIPKVKSLCKCALCRRNRKFYRITAKLPVKDREWMRNFYDFVINEEEDLDMHRAYLKALA